MTSCVTLPSRYTRWQPIFAAIVALVVVGCLPRGAPDRTHMAAAPWVQVRIPAGWEMVRGAKDLDMVVIWPAGRTASDKRQPVHISIIRTELRQSGYMSYDMVIAADELVLRHREPGSTIIRKPVSIGGQVYTGVVAQVTRDGLAAEHWVVSVLGNGVVYTIMFWDHTGKHRSRIQSVLDSLKLDGVSAG